MKKVSKKMILVLTVRNLVLILITIGIFLAMMFGIEDFPKSVMICLGVFLACLFIFLLIYPFLYYRRYSYYYDENRVYITCGVIFHHQTVVPICNLQDIHLVQGPVMQLVHLHSLMVSTAGSNFVIQCLFEEDAKKMLSDLEANMNQKHCEVQTNEEVL